MEHNSTSPAQTVIGDLDGLWPTLFDCLEAAVATAVEDFQRRQRPVEPFHLASGVRNEFFWRMKEGGLQGCRVAALSNNGVMVEYGGYHLRLLKMDEEGGVPDQGRSAAFQGYCEQLPLLPEGTEGFLSPGALKLVLLWKFDSETHSLGALHLWLPSEWTVVIPQPVPHQQPVEVEVEEELIAIDLIEDGIDENKVG
ncbi:MAG: hypothetical protein IPJ17_00220 [Holophagales bacterium]|nr:MAG: hypothetical protein IPJ17_00220 [Holophagales bacterium]